ncbi:MAG: inositol monophosphatase [Candidatus Kerfeldbacteria bacterium]|nr:inositol monophosphatase [Candidatus Kerfeldbacteria bacterium]
MTVLKEFAIGLALRAGNMLMREFRALAPEQIRFKDKRELVTKHDRNVNRFLVSKIKHAYPDHTILSEEQGLENNKRNSEFMWVVDPLDGTTNFVMRHTFFTTTMALLRNGDPVLGVIYAPYTRELFVAEKGKGASRNEVRMHVSNEDKLRSSFLCFSYSHERKSLRRAISAYQHFEFEARSMRHFGSASLELAFVAAGRVDGMIITPPVRVWDVAAGILMVQEAGGKVTDFYGQPRRVTYDGLVVSNGKVHKQILRVIKDKRI